MKQHTISILVENKSGVLTRVTNLFSRRSYNIDSLAVGETQDERVSRITLCLTATEDQIKQILKFLYKMPDVISAKHLTNTPYFARQLCFIKIHATNKTRSEIGQIVNIFRGHIIDLSNETLTIEITGTDEKIDALLNNLQPFGVIELVRTGLIAIERGTAHMKMEIADSVNHIIE